MTRIISEWRSGMNFAEFAEAIGINTSDVLAAWSSDGETTSVLFTRAYADLESLVLQTELTRDADGILVASPDQQTEFKVADLFKARP